MAAPGRRGSRGEQGGNSSSLQLPDSPPWKKLDFPLPLAPTTTLTLGVKGSRAVCSLYDLNPSMMTCHMGDCCAWMGAEFAKFACNFPCISDLNAEYTPHGESTSTRGVEIGKCATSRPRGCSPRERQIFPSTHPPIRHRYEQSAGIARVPHLFDVHYPGFVSEKDPIPVCVLSGTGTL